MGAVLFFAQIIERGKVDLPKTKANQEAIDTVITEVYIAIGAVAVLFLIIAGLRYVMAQGEPAKISAAKNMVLYTVIGVVIAALAATIINYVLTF